MKIMNSRQIYAAEAAANAAGLAFSDMMETAGQGCAQKIREAFPEGGRVLILCGKGKNAGDGFVIARALCGDGAYSVQLALVFGPVSERQSAEMFEKTDTYTVGVLDYTLDPAAVKRAVKNADIIVDAVFGIGFYGELSEAVAELFDEVNASEAQRVAIDIPSGIAADGTACSGHSVKADITLTMLTPKPAHILLPSALYCGKTEVVDIGFKPEGECEFFCADEEYLSSLLPRRPENSNKGMFGHVLSICGSLRMPGAAVFAAKASVECGAGLVTAAFPRSAYSAVTSFLSEPLFAPLDENGEGRLSAECVTELDKLIKKASVIILGCGLGLDGDVKSVVYHVLKNAVCPIILDADGINAAAENIDILKEAKAPLILTPHPGEMSRLTGLSVSDIQSARLESARNFAARYGVTLVLKGSRTVIAGADGRVFVNTTGNPGMARGGSGDTLSGIIAALVANSVGCTDAAAAGAYLHGAAGDAAAARYSVLGATPARLLEQLPELLKIFG